MENVQDGRSNFSYKYNDGTGLTEVAMLISIPASTTQAQELTGRMISKYNIPPYAVEGLIATLCDFVKEKSAVYYEQIGDEAVDALIKQCPEELASKWASKYKQNHAAYAKPQPITNDEVFAEIYHNLIHSPALDTLLTLEHTYAVAVADLISKRDQNLKKVEEIQAIEMNHAVQNLGKGFVDSDVNDIAAKHFENIQLVESKWASEISALKETQKREYREFVMNVQEHTQSTQGPAFLPRLRALSEMGDEQERDAQNATRWEESFTIHLGAQLKTTHNLRLLCADILDLCRHKTNKVEGIVVPQPQRLQTAMSLYSNSLCALVLLVDNRLNSYTGIKREFARVCEVSTDFHFPDLESQFETIQADAVRANEIREQNKAEQSLDGGSIASNHSGASGNSDNQKEERHKNLKVGDFYTTRHSNLSEVHVVFHLVCDSSVLSGDITSRNAVILGLRNILKMASRYDITTITLPLLLTHEMTEEMTMPWCLKRAELIFKCIKGFMIESLSWGGTEANTLQFLVPQGVSEEAFTSFSEMLTQIFRISNPLVIKTTS